jgi:nitrate reductase NapAB chaperone NapD
VYIHLQSYSNNSYHVIFLFISQAQKDTGSDSAELIFTDLLEGDMDLKPVETDDVILPVNADSIIGHLSGRVVDMVAFDHIFCALVIESNTLKCCLFKDKPPVSAPYQTYDIPLKEKQGKIFCMYPENSSCLPDRATVEENRIICLGNTSFNQLFQYSFNLLDLPFCVILLPSGHVYAVPILTKPNVQASKPVLLYDLQQEPCNLHRLDASSVVIVGNQGKLVCIQSGENGAMFEELQLPGNVTCSLVYHQYLLLTCGRELVWTDLSWLKEHADSTSEVQVVSCQFYNAVSLLLMNPPGEFLVL